MCSSQNGKEWKGSRRYRLRFRASHARCQWSAIRTFGDCPYRIPSPRKVMIKFHPDHQIHHIPAIQSSYSKHPRYGIAISCQSSKYLQIIFHLHTSHQNAEWPRSRSPLWLEVALLGHSPLEVRKRHAAPLRKPAGCAVFVPGMLFMTSWHVVTKS